MLIFISILTMLSFYYLFLFCFCSFPCQVKAIALLSLIICTLFLFYFIIIYYLSFRLLKRGVLLVSHNTEKLPQTYLGSGLFWLNHLATTRNPLATTWTPTVPNSNIPSNIPTSEYHKGIGVGLTWGHGKLQHPGI